MSGFLSQEFLLFSQRIHLNQEPEQARPSVAWRVPRTSFNPCAPCRSLFFFLEGPMSFVPHSVPRSAVADGAARCPFSVASPAVPESCRFGQTQVRWGFGGGFWFLPEQPASEVAVPASARKQAPLAAFQSSLGL